MRDPRDDPWLGPPRPDIPGGGGALPGWDPRERVFDPVRDHRRRDWERLNAMGGGRGAPDGQFPSPVADDYAYGDERGDPYDDYHHDYQREHGARERGGRDYGYADFGPGGPGEDASYRPAKNDPYAPIKDTDGNDDRAIVPAQPPFLDAVPRDDDDKARASVKVCAPSFAFFLILTISELLFFVFPIFKTR
jgi:hypothetical protein